MRALSRILAYAFAGIPAVVGIWFIADYAFATSDDGWSAAFQLGLIAVLAYTFPAFALIVAGNGRRVAAFLLGCLAVGAMFANWSVTLDALANRGAGKEADQAKLSVTVKTDRARLERIERERATLPNVYATDETVRAAHAAVTAAERIRVAECDKRGPNCRLRESEEQAKRDALARVLDNKATADKATKLDREIAEISVRLAKAPAAKETSAGKTLGSLLSLSAVAAATFQQQFLSAIVELGIAACLALPELLRPKHAPVAKREEEPEAEPAASEQHHAVAEPLAAPVRRMRSIAGVELAEPPAPATTGDLRAFMLACLPRHRGGETPLTTVYARYVRWCEEQTPPVAAKAVGLFAPEFRMLCDRARIATEKRGGKVVCLGVKLVA